MPRFRQRLEAASIVETTYARPRASGEIEKAQPRQIELLEQPFLRVLALDGFTTGTPDMYESTMEKWLIVKAQV